MIFHIITSLISIIGFSFLWSILDHFYQSSKRRDILPEKFLFENTVQAYFNMNIMLDWMRSKEATLPPNQQTFCVNLFGLPWLVSTQSIENITFILKNVDMFGKGPNWTARFSGLLGRGIFNSDGETWYHHRKLSANLFKMSSFKNEMIDTFYDHCQELIDVLMESPQGQKFDIQHMMFNFTLESIGKIGFGVKFGALREKR
jgi:cytochrome P450